MKKRYKNIICACIVSICTICLTACGAKKGTSEAISTDSNATVQELQTEQDYRTAIEKLGTDEDSLKLKVEYFNALWQMDVFTEGDFDSLILIYEELGYMEEVRETLIRKHTYYPSEENLALISNVVVAKDSSDQAVATLMQELTTYIVDKSTDNVNVLIVSEDWIKAMQDDLLGVSRRTKYTGDSYVAQIISDTYSTTIYILWNDGVLTYYKCSEAGVVWGSTSWSDSSYNGTYEITYYNQDGSFIKECRGTFTDGISTGSFEMDFDGDTYVGEFDDAGLTMVEQNEDVSENGGVTYAYNSSGRKYLYVENISVDSFVIDNAYLGLPLYEEWK
ncbi:MAG: hypothetical protein J6J16_11145 [Lachnospiraceae bacterium]|nr:hypothetical protein [Lachnospiraceae bacterium]